MWLLTLMNTVNIFRKSIAMGFFGAKSLKPTWLYSTETITEIDKFQKTSSKMFCKKDGWQTAKQYTDKKGTKKVVGGKDLKRSQSYPAGFGCAVQKLYKCKAETMQKRYLSTKLLLKKQKAVLVDVTSKRGDRWKDAELDGVFSLLHANSEYV